MPLPDKFSAGAHVFEQLAYEIRENLTWLTSGWSQTFVLTFFWKHFLRNAYKTFLPAFVRFFKSPVNDAAKYTGYTRLKINHECFKKRATNVFTLWNRFLEHSVIRDAFSKFVNNNRPTTINVVWWVFVSVSHIYYSTPLLGFARSRRNFDNTDNQY